MSLTTVRRQENAGNSELKNVQFAGAAAPADVSVVPDRPDLAHVFPQKFFESAQSLHSPSAIADLPVGKGKRNALHRVVQAFWVAAGIKATGGDRQSPQYQNWLNRLTNLPLAGAEADAIAELSSEEGYTTVRNAGRLRNTSHPPVEGSALTQLCREIRAALVWRVMVDLHRSQEVA